MIVNCHGTIRGSVPDYVCRACVRKTARDLDGVLAEILIRFFKNNSMRREKLNDIMVE